MMNFGDAPFFKERVPPQVIPFMTRIAIELPREGPNRATALLRDLLIDDEAAHAN